MTNLVRRKNFYPQSFGLFGADAFDVFDEFFNSKRNSGLQTVKTNNNINVTDNEYSWKISLAAPGLTKKDFNVSLKNNTLSIGYSAGETNTNMFTKGSYTKSWSVPDTVVSEDISAMYKNGILSVAIAKPKAEEPVETTIEVK
jgi:HSP20 family protein